MQDNEKLVERLAIDARNLEKDDWIVVAFRVHQAATTIEAQAREIAELRARFDNLDTIHEALDECYVKVEAERDTLRTQLTETQARLAEAVGLITEIVIRQENDTTLWVPEWQIWAVDARAFLSKQEPKP